MIDRRDLVRALQRRQLADWVIVEREQELAVVDQEEPATRRNETRTRWQLIVHADTPQGRGTARIALDALDGDADALVEQAGELASAAVGPAWVGRPPAAPAQVAMADEAIAKRWPLEIADDIVRGTPRPAGTKVTATARVLREHVSLITRAGFRAEWDATLASLEALVVGGDHSLAVARQSRRLDGLDLGDALAGAAKDLELLAKAQRPTAGPCAVILGADAMLADGELGVWAAFEAQADPVVERQGLTRYREHAPIAAGAAQVPEPLSIESDGAIDYGIRSAPLGDEGDAVRRFTLVDRGLAAGLGLSPREAALRKRDPNGGVRNLVVALGTWAGEVSAPRVVEVRRLRSLQIDRYTGEASLEIALAIDRQGGNSVPFAGGSLRLDLIAALARSRRSATPLERGAYRGPASVLIERAELIA